MFQERYYQIEASDAAASAVLKSGDCHTIVAMPTGSGKSPTMCLIVDKILSARPTSNILILSHVKEILEQDHSALDRYFEGEIELGLYSAGLNSKTIKKITVAGIQSVFRKVKEFSRFDFVIIDECHLISTDGTTMYRSFLKKIKANYVGLTATPFRTGHGYLHIGKDALFNDLCYDLTSFENFNRLVDEGYLSQIFSKKTALKLNIEKVKTVAGDFSQKDLSSKIDRDNITEAAILESLHYGKKYKHWLVFAIDIQHAKNITNRLIAHGINSVAIHSEMENRDEILTMVKAGKYRAVVNVDILTTGFDFPAIDLIILMRPTKSPIIHVQTIGRGLRVLYKEGYDLETIDGRLSAIENSQKPHCLVLDFAGNAARLGPINDVKVKTKGEGKGGGGPMVKDCPECSMENHLSAKVCKNCDFEFPTQEKLQKEASMAEVVKFKEVKKKNIAGWLRVDSIGYHLKAGRNRSPDYVVVHYQCGITKIKENIMLEHNGYARHRAKHWVKFRWEGTAQDFPSTSLELIKNSESLRKPKRIYADTTERYAKITDSEF